MKLVQRRWPNIDQAFFAAKVIVSFDGRIVLVLPEPTEMTKRGVVVWFELQDAQDVDALDAIIEGF
jgi:hypothetical protein